MRFALILLAACNGSSGTDGGTLPDGQSSDGSTGMDASMGADTSTDDSGGMQDSGGPITCVIPKGGAVCGGAQWQCDETNDCAPGMACCLTLDMMVVKGSSCTGFCNNPRLQLCQSSMECSGGMNCMTTTCSGFVVNACGGVPANLCK